MPLQHPPLLQRRVPAGRLQDAQGTVHALAGQGHWPAARRAPGDDGAGQQQCVRRVFQGGEAGHAAQAGG